MSDRMDIGHVGPAATAATNHSNGSVLEDEDNRILEESLSLAKIKALSKAKRLNEHSADLDRQSKRLRVEAERLDQESKQFKLNAKAAIKLSESLNFETLLLRLRRNDTNTTNVSDQELPSQCAKPLGEALLQNTMVTSLGLDLSHCLAHVSGDDEIEKEMQALLKFISKPTTSLRSFSAIRQNDLMNFRTIARILLDAISKKQCLESLTWDLPVCARTFRSLASNLSSLHELDMLIFGAVTYSDSSQRTIATAFRSMKALKKLKLHVEQNVDLYIRILSSLTTLSTLQELTLVSSSDCHDNFDAAVSQFLRDTITLRRFEMVKFLLDAATMTAILSSLQLQHVSTLSLRRCVIPEEECVQLASWLQTRATSNDGETAVNSSLRELHISDDVGTALSQTLSSQIALSILEAYRTDATQTELREPPFLPTIGSQLYSLSLGDVDPSFFSTTKDNASRFRVQHLELSRLSLAACVAFRKCFPFLTSICKLKISNVQDAKGLAWILHGIKNSRSIRKVSTGNGIAAVQFSASQLRLIRAYCKRNQLLDKLLQIEQPVEDGDNGSGNHDATSADSTATRTTVAMGAATVASVASMKLSLLPPLLVATQQVPTRTGWSVLTRSLLVLGQSLGSDDDSKGSDEK